jgi:hypothetical protein
MLIKRNLFHLQWKRNRLRLPQLSMPTTSLIVRRGGAGRVPVPTSSSSQVFVEFFFRTLAAGHCKRPTPDAIATHHVRN